MRKRLFRSLLIGVLSVLTLSTPIISAAQTQIQWSAFNEPGSAGWLTGIAVSPFDSNRVLLAGDILDVGISTDQGETWGLTYGFQNYDDEDFTFHPYNPNEVWVGTRGGPYKSTDGGVNWTLKRNGMPTISYSTNTLPIGKILYNPKDSTMLLAFAGMHRENSNISSSDSGSIWESKDSGENWTKISDGPVNNIGYGIQYAVWGPDGNVYVAILGSSVSASGVYKSVDMGRNWMSCSKGLPVLNAKWLQQDPRDPNTLYVSLKGGGGIYKTTDGGDNWFAANSGLNIAADYWGVSLVASSPDVLYTGNMSGAIYKSLNGGNTWSTILSSTTGNMPQRAFPVGANLRTMTVDPNNPDTCFFGTSEDLWRTNDGGVTWKILTNAQVGSNEFTGTGYSGICTTQFVFNPKEPNTALFTGADAGKLLISNDGFKSWWRGGSDTNGLEAWSGAYASVFAGSDGQTLYTITGQAGKFRGIAKSTNGGKNWVLFSGRGISTDGGSTWTAVSGEGTGLPDFNSTANAGNAMYAETDNADTVYATVGSRLFRTRDGGYHWDTLFTDTINNANVGPMKVDKNNPQVVYMASSQGVFKIENISADTPTFNLMLDSTKYAVDMDIDSSGNIYVAKYNNSTDGGINKYDVTTGIWSRILNDIYAQAVAIDPFDETHIAAAMTDDNRHDVTRSKGVYISNDSGATWRLENQGLSFYRSNNLIFNPHIQGQLILGTVGKGFFSTSTVITEDFNSGAAINWDLTNATVSNSKMQLSSVSKALYTNLIGGDYSFKVDMQLSSQNNADKSSILFNYQNESNYYSLEFGGGTNGSIILKKKVADVDITIASYPLPYDTTSSEATIEVNYGYAGNITVKGYKNGIRTEIFNNVLDTAIKTGTVGVATANTSCSFDNVVLTLAPPKVVPNVTPLLAVASSLPAGVPVPGAVLFTDLTDATVTQLTGGAFIQGKVDITNNNTTFSNATLFVVLYDTNNGVKNIAVMEKKISQGQTETFSAGFKLPDNINGCYVRAFIWDRLKGMVPLSGEYGIN